MKSPSPSPSLRLRFLGANRQVTGSRHVLEAAGRTIMVDCGLFQEREFAARNWEPSPVPPEAVDVLLLTHAHLDHCGLIPAFVRDGFRGEILATAPTIELARIVLEDSARIQVEDAAYKRRRHEREGRRGRYPEVPLYTPEEAEAACRLFRPVHYDRPHDLGAGITARYLDAGHILGSALIDVSVPAPGHPLRVVFSGDLGPWDRPLMHDPTVLARADAVVMESTYGDRDHEPVEDAIATLADVVNDTVARGGNVVIPTFAIDRAQEILDLFSQLTRTDRIPRLTVFLDSPMAIDVTRVYKDYAALLDADTRRRMAGGEHPFQFPGLHFVRTAHESRSINSIRGSCVILAGSGMCTGGRVKHHLRQNIERPESTVLFAGYQSRGTLGRQIVDGNPQVRIHGRSYTVRARIARLEGLSAHAGRSDLLRWLGRFEDPAPAVFLTHGEEEAMTALAERIRRDLGGTVHRPEYDSTHDVVRAT